MVMKVRRVLAGLGAGVLVLVMGPAMATGNSYTVAVGGSSTSGQASFTASSDATVLNWVEKPDGTFSRWTCAASAVPAGSGSFVSKGTNLTDLAQLKGLTITTCTWFGGNLNASTSGTWTMHATSATTTASTDSVSVHLENVNIGFSNAVCSFRVSGGFDGTFNEANQKLTIDEKADGTGQEATVTNVVGCLGQLKNNGKFKFQGTFSTSVAGGAVNIQP